MINVLISVIQTNSHYVPLPNIWGILRAYCDRQDDLKSEVNWWRPINEDGTVDPISIVNRYSDAEITALDVVGLSCYNWGTMSQLSIAKEIKRRNPDCIIVMGGADAPHNDMLFFKNHPYIDIIVKQDGEIPFSKIVRKAKNKEKDFSDIPGLILPGPLPIDTGKTELITYFDWSHWLLYKDFYEKIILELQNQGRKVHAVVETVRGCPFGCTFCDWGQFTMSKLRKFDMEMLKKEISWLCDVKIGSIHSGDANSGILKRDVELIRHLADEKRRTGFPYSYHLAYAKTTTEDVMEIADILHKAHLCVHRNVPVQSTNQEVLDIMNRQGIRNGGEKKVITHCNKNDIPMIGQLIMGPPGCHPNSWRTSITDVMEWGLHDEIVYFPYELLPNSPANDEEYKKKYEIETMSRIPMLETGAPRVGKENNNKKSYICSTSTYDRTDYWEFLSYGKTIAVCHFFGITKFISQYLRFTHSVRFKDFYDDLYDNFFSSENYPMTFANFDTIKEHLKQYVFASDDQDNIFIEMIIDEFKQDDRKEARQPEEILMFKLLMNIDIFFEELTEHLVQKYPTIKNLNSVLHFQKNMMIDYNYDRRVGRQIVLKHDWPTYFAEARSYGFIMDMEEPVTLNSPLIMNINNQTNGFASSSTASELNWLEDNNEFVTDYDKLQLYRVRVIPGWFIRVGKSYFTGHGFY